MAKKSLDIPFVFGGDAEAFCDECQLPCNLEEMNIDCYRRFFLAGNVKCSYFVYGYCFLIDEPGCVFDNGGRHDSYWLQILNRYFHNVDNINEDEEFLKHKEEVKQLIGDQIEKQNVFLCRYIEEYYSRVMEMGGGLSEEMLSKLDNAYLSLLKGIKRKTE